VLLLFYHNLSSPIEDSQPFLLERILVLRISEALGGFRLTGDNTLELLRVDQQNSIPHNVAGNVSADHTDEWSAVVRWLLDYGKDAVVSPSSTLTIWALVSRDSSPTTGAPVRMDLLVHSPLNPKSPNPPV
jgi:hypothetical protein